MAFYRPSLPELIERVDRDVLSRLPESRAALETRLTRVLATAEAGAVHGLYGYLQWLERQLFPETCDDGLLYLHAAGVPRREAARASGQLRFEGADGAVIPEGTLLHDDGQEYTTLAEGRIEDGEVLVQVSAVEPGRAGDRTEGEMLGLVSPVSGVSSSAEVVESGLSGGVDQESYDTWRERIKRRRARTPRGGAEGDWEEWALQVPGVTRAWEDPHGMGPGTMVVRIMADDASDGPLPSDQLRQQVRDYIDSQRNVLAVLYVTGPQPVEFRPRVWITPSTDGTRAAVASALQDLVEREGEPGGTLLISRIRGAVGTAAGVDDYDVEWPNTNVSYSNGELPIWGGVEWPQN